MQRGLLLSVRFHDGRYHGAGDWPPSPARLFQALVAGAACGGALSDQDKVSLIWLENLQAPVIAAPLMHSGQGFTNFVPNNDLDAVGGDPRRVGEIRAGKVIRPRIFNVQIPLLYAWPFPADEEEEHRASQICILAERLYQLGRSADMAWAVAEVLEWGEIEARLAAHQGPISRPCKNGGNGALACPAKGSLKSLEDRFCQMRKRFAIEKKGEVLFTQPSKPCFMMQPYDSPSARLLYELRETTQEAKFRPWPLTKALALVEQLRDCAAEKLKRALPDEAGVIDRVFIGRDATEADKAARLQITPLPSIGHAHADHAIRRVLVEIPPNCPLRAGDIGWTFSGLPVASSRGTGEIWRVLMRTGDEGMLEHFGAGEAFRVWRTVTPAALPQKAARRRIDPARIHDRTEQKEARERIEEEARAKSAVQQALQHAQVDAPAETIRVQREPFEAKGARAEAFAVGSRFAKERLWHVEIAFAKPVRGPLVLGDGRYLGLGLFAPRLEPRPIFAFALNGARALRGQEAVIAAAARRAVMSRMQEEQGRGKPLPAFFSGHEPNGAPHRPGHHAHLFYAIDVASEPAQLFIIAPHVVEHRDSNWDEQRDLKQLEEALARFTILRAGKAGLFKLSALGESAPDDPLFGAARTWVSASPYRPARHPKRGMSVEDALAADVLSECLRRNLPRPEVEVISYQIGPRGGVQAHIRLTFAVTIEGPIALGKDAHESGGLFKIEALSPH
jgi:CRISPR-associated protein Csb2